MEFKQFYKCQTILNSLLTKIYELYIKDHHKEVKCPFVPNYLFLEERLKQFSLNNLEFLNHLLSPKMYDYINKPNVLEMLAKCYVELKKVQINKLCEDDDISNEFLYLFSVIDIISESEPPPPLTTAVIGRDGSDFQSIWNRLNNIDDKYLDIHKEIDPNQQHQQNQQPLTSISTKNHKLSQHSNSNSSKEKINSSRILNPIQINSSSKSLNSINKNNADISDNTINNNKNNNTIIDNNNGNNENRNKNTINNEKNNSTSNKKKYDRSLSNVKRVESYESFKKSNSILSLNSNVLSRLSSVYVSEQCLNREQAKIDINNKDFIDNQLQCDKKKKENILQNKVYDMGINEAENMKKNTKSNKSSENNKLTGTYENQIFEKNKYKSYFIDVYEDKDIYGDIYYDEELSIEEAKMKKMKYKKYAKILINLKDFRSCVVNVLKRLKIEGLKKNRPEYVDSVENLCDSHLNKRSAYYTKENYGKTNKVSYFKHCTIGNDGFYYSLKREEYRDILIYKHLVRFLNLQLIACYRILIVGLQLVQRITMSAQAEALITKRRMNDLLSIFPEIINTVKLYKYLKSNNYSLAIELLKDIKGVCINTFSYFGRTVLHVAINPTKGTNPKDQEAEKKLKKNAKKKKNLRYYDNKYYPSNNNNNKDKISIHITTIAIIKFL
ncbi:hypothetical protein H8356DRAFT_406439 [Neocallimastix lanati (nom. inval.)]|nr:hypothetical protein H8356DRAFT_406439 [Neocallimastix sp. JGI-2020a]